MINLQNFVQAMYAKKIEDCSDQELYYALLALSKQRSEAQYTNEQKKKVYYISAEFLIGKLLSNNLINLGIYDEVKGQLAAAGKDLLAIEDVEMEPSLGNGAWAVWLPASWIRLPALASMGTVLVSTIISDFSVSCSNTTNNLLCQTSGLLPVHG